VVGQRDGGGGRGGVARDPSARVDAAARARRADAVAGFELRGKSATGEAHCAVGGARARLSKGPGSRPIPPLTCPSYIAGQVVFCAFRLDVPVRVPRHIAK
jgi:hypothetical protein